jgi:hypothetical protein
VRTVMSWTSDGRNHRIFAKDHFARQLSTLVGSRH